MNLENLNLVELNAREELLTDGGYITPQEICWAIEFIGGVIEGFRQNR